MSGDNETCMYAINMESAEGQRLQALLDDGETEKVNAFIRKKVRKQMMEEVKQRIQFNMMRDAIVCAHHCMHTEQAGRGIRLLAAAAAWFADNDEVPPIESMFDLVQELGALKAEIEKAGCAGSA